MVIFFNKIQTCYGPYLDSSTQFPELRHGPDEFELRDIIDVMNVH